MVVSLGSQVFQRSRSKLIREFGELAIWRLSDVVD
jgi:hypothetical protein